VVTAGRSPGGDGPGRRSSCRRASSWRRPGRSRKGPPAPANRSARAWGRRRCRGGWRRRGYSSCIGSPGAHSPPVRSAGPRPVLGTRMWGSSRLLPLFPGVDPGLELGGGIGEHGPQHGEAAGLLLGRRRAEASRRGSVGRNLGEGIGPALALGQGWVRITSAHKNPLPVRRVFRGSPRPLACPQSALASKESNEPPRWLVPVSGVRAFIQRRVLTLNPLAGFAGESRRAGRDRPIYI